MAAVRMNGESKVLVPSAEITRQKVMEESRLRDPEAKIEDWELDFEVKPNLWLQAHVGFYPLFLAVGSRPDDIRMTGYDSQWRRKQLEWYDNKAKKRRSLLRKAGRFRNSPLFSFVAIPEGTIFLDYEVWFYVLNGSHCDYKIAPSVVRRIFKPSYNRADWLRFAKSDSGSVMAVVPRLDLATADRIWVRNEDAKAECLAMGFRNVQVKRMLLLAD